jgi:hypothetical protein
MVFFNADTGYMFNIAPEILKIFVQSKLNQFEPSNLHDSKRLKCKPDTKGSKIVRNQL